MEQNQQFQCSGDCLRCSVAQRQYCSCQHAYNTMRLIQTMNESLKTMSGTIEGLKAKVAAIQDSEALIFDPTDTSQEGDGEIE